MADTNLNTSIAALKTEILNAIPTATVDELLSLARSAKGMNLGEDTQIETAINSRANTLTASATTSEVIKLAAAIKQVLNPAAITVTNISSVTGHLIPDADDTHDLGSASNKFRELYLSGNSINLGNQTISSSSTGIIVPEIQVGTGTNNVKLTANSDGELVQTGTNSSGQQQDPTQGGGGGASVVTNISDLPTSGNTAGAQALVTATNTVFMWTGTAWYKIATMTNESPTAITGVNATYTLATDGTPTVITAVSSDPEGATLSWSYAVSSGALNGTTVSQGTGANTNQFTVTPHASQSAAFDLTFSATDNVNGAVTSSSSFTLSFAYEFTNNTAPQISSASILPASSGYSSYFDPNPLPLGRHYFEVTFSGRPTNATISFALTRLDALYTTQGGEQDPTQNTPNLYWGGTLQVQLNHPSSSGNGAQANSVVGKHPTSTNGTFKIFSAGPNGTMYGNWWEYDASHIFGYRLMVAYDTGNFSSGGNRGASIYYGLQGSWGVNYGGSAGSGNTPPSGGITLDPNTQTNPQGGWSSMPNGLTGHPSNGYTYYTDSDPFYIGIDRDYGVATSATFTIHRGASECIYTLPTNYSYL